jgi:hypothetical protein
LMENVLRDLPGYKDDLLKKAHHHHSHYHFGQNRTYTITSKNITCLTVLYMVTLYL